MKKTLNRKEVKRKVRNIQNFLISVSWLTISSTYTILLHLEKSEIRLSTNVISSTCSFISRVRIFLTLTYVCHVDSFMTYFVYLSHTLYVNILIKLLLAGGKYTCTQTLSSTLVTGTSLYLTQCIACRRHVEIFCGEWAPLQAIV